jgi:hypothetical protein
VAQPLEHRHFGGHDPNSLGAQTVDRGRVIGEVSRACGIAYDLTSWHFDVLVEFSLIERNRSIRGWAVQW